MTREEAVLATMEAIEKWDPQWAAQDWTRLSPMERHFLKSIGDKLMAGDIDAAFEELKNAHKAWILKGGAK